MAFYPSKQSAQSSGLIHYWPMQELSGEDVADIIGGWGGKIVGTGSAPSPSDIQNSIVTTPVGYGRNLGVRYAGAEQDILPIELQAPAPSLTPLSEVTIRIRFFLTSQGSAGWWSPFGLGRGSGAAILTQYTDGYGLDYQIGTRSGNPGGNPFTVGQWHDLVITAGPDAPSGPGIKFYVNGVEVFSSTSGSSFFDIYQSSGAAIRGCLGAQNWYSGGQLVFEALADIIVQDFAIWNRSLSQIEVQDLNNAGLSTALTPPPPVDLQFDAQATIAGDFIASTDSAEGFVLGATITAQFRLYQDWLASLPKVQLQELYRLVITGAPDSLDDLIIGGISSWQATNQAGSRSSYVQAVIPAADRYLADITDRPNGELVIQKGYKLSSGEIRFEEIIRARFDEARPDEGRSSLTLTVSGYMSGKLVSTGARTLTGIRRTSKPNGKRRVTCDIDLFLQPGMTVTALGESFKADFINYYVNQSDKFCEVGER